MVKIWIDDERDPKDPFIQKYFYANGDELWIKTAEDAINYIQRLIDDNVSEFHIAFDHDLGYGKSGYDVACFIEQMVNDGYFETIRYSIHTQNPIGYENISKAMSNVEKMLYNRKAVSS